MSIGSTYYIVIIALSLLIHYPTYYLISFVFCGYFTSRSGIKIYNSKNLYLNMNHPEESPNNQLSNPTVRPVNPFDPRWDAQLLHRAMDWTHEYTIQIIEVLANRVYSQRQEIAIQFKSMFGKDLISELIMQLDGYYNMRKIILGLMTPTCEFLAKEVHDALTSPIDEKIIIEIICTASNAEFNNIKMAYNNLFGNDLEKELMEKKSGSFRRLLVSLFQGRRNENTFVDVASTQADAQNLLQAYELQSGTDDSTFNMILCSRSFCQLQQVFLEYRRLTGKDFEDVINSEEFVNIRLVVQTVRDKIAYFANQLMFASRPCFGYDERPLLRIIATRWEMDMVEIKNAYMSMYGISLADDIGDDFTLCEYKRSLKVLVRDRK
ncbi:annexin B9-like [Acyrthosiphon pisum]|uniref:Annexin n=1 Tax=Acyrthosiphon pisum TaxID=7029 RepID=A0A8R2F8S9_ACYPI|nr:annexin B9-like [Acyrthosiphon pisum]|eukprot:XP_008183556.2 PREDICTED: annexin B9-like [Acyrthosiphon pisum]